LTGRVDRDDDAFDDVRLSTEQRLEFLDGQRAVGLRIASTLATCLATMQAEEGVVHRELDGSGS